MSRVFGVLFLVAFVFIVTACAPPRPPPPTPVSAFFIPPTPAVFAPTPLPQAVPPQVVIQPSPTPISSSKPIAEVRIQSSPTPRVVAVATVASPPTPTAAPPKPDSKAPPPSAAQPQTQPTRQRVALPNVGALVRYLSGRWVSIQEQKTCIGIADRITVSGQNIGGALLNRTYDYVDPDHIMISTGVTTIKYKIDAFNDAFQLTRVAQDNRSAPDHCIYLRYDPGLYTTQPTQLTPSNLAGYLKGSWKVVREQTWSCDLGDALDVTDTEITGGLGMTMPYRYVDATRFSIALGPMNQVYQLHTDGRRILITPAIPGQRPDRFCTYERR